MADTQLQLPPGYEDAQPVKAQSSNVQLPPGYEDARPVSAKTPTPDTKPAEISADHGGVGSWLERAENDLRYGGESTWLGKAAHTIGMPGIRRGVSESTGDLLGGVVEAPVHAAQATHELATGHPIKAANKTVQTLGDVALPVAVAAPEMLPLMAPRISGAVVGSKLGSAVAPHLTEDPDKQELISNVGGTLGAASPEIIEHGTAPVIRGTAKT